MLALGSCTADPRPESDQPDAEHAAVVDEAPAEVPAAVPPGPATHPVFELHRIRVHRYGDEVHVTALGELRHAGPPVAFGGYRPAALVGFDDLQPDVSLSLVHGTDEAYLGSATWPVPRLRPTETVAMRIPIDDRRLRRAAKQLGVDVEFLSADVEMVKSKAAGEAFTYYDAPSSLLASIRVDVDTEAVSGDAATETAPKLRIVPRASDCFLGPLLPMCQWFLRVDNENEAPVGMLVAQAILRDDDGKVVGVDTTNNFSQKRYGGLAVDVLQPSASAFFTVGSHVADPTVLVADPKRRHVPQQPPDVDVIVWGAPVP